MKVFHKLANELQDCPRTWLVTGCAGFIGSNLVEFLLRHDQKVTGLDNFSTGHRRNLADVQSLVTKAQWQRFRLIEGDMRDIDTCRRAVAGVDHVLQQAALGSVPRSVDDPLASNDSNVNGFLNILVAAKDAHVKSFVFAASSAAYGDHAGLPKREDVIGKPLSPYAVTKYVNELYAEAFSRCYGFDSVGLRYFNVFGKRQDPDGAYAAVIPRWIRAMCEGEDVVINGDGCTSRDFCHVANIVQANILASMLRRSHGSAIYNVAVNGTTTLNQLFAYLRAILRAYGISVDRPPLYAQFRNGDIRHLQADIGKAVRELGYSPEYQIFAGLETTVPWYLRQGKTTDALRLAPRAPGRPPWPAGLPAQAPAATRAVLPLAE